MLEIQIVSDLHLEFWQTKTKFNFVQPAADILALLGDICCWGSDNDFETFKKFIYEILPLYKTIIMVPGNHEYYFNTSNSSEKITQLKTIEGIDQKIRKFFRETSSKKLL